ncbi:hypothetical protein SBRY_50236 [Actinacidiphila bryophytorum]|uniref:Uncharacterized protein n=1 Tax=Actinacidiphila bryophytorum TaxID=1436133 RepID=A0A9W4H4K4_9ACTN|nr:hypothetical protein SBRY_50236 [Actinacidiphila bryophytorum]
METTYPDIVRRLVKMKATNIDANNQRAYVPSQPSAAVPQPHRTAGEFWLPPPTKEHSCAERDPLPRATAGRCCPHWRPSGCCSPRS